MSQPVDAVQNILEGSVWARAGIVLLVMCTSGILGSYCRRIWEKEGIDRVKYDWVWPGIAASLVVPLFLSVGGNSIFTKVLDNTIDSGAMPDLFLIAGFCILAGVAAPNFVNALAHKALSIAKEADKKAERAENLGEIAAEPTENTDQTAQRPPPETVRQQANSIDDPIQRMVFNSLVNSEYSWRALGGISAATGLDRTSVRRALAELKSNGLVVDKISDKSGSVLYQPRV